jgi:hypothetical protein
MTDSVHHGKCSIGSTSESNCPTENGERMIDIFGKLISKMDHPHTTTVELTPELGFDNGVQYTSNDHGDERVSVQFWGTNSC